MSDKITQSQKDFFNNNGYFDCPDPNDLNECDQYEDVNNDGKYTPGDYKDNFQRTTDVNGDGIPDDSDGDGVPDYLDND